jgi:cardiolipin synthase
MAAEVRPSAKANVPELLYDQKFWLNIFFAAEWAVRLAMIVIVPFRRSPDAAKGWLLLIFFEPAAGLILYLLIGRPTLPVWRLVRHADFEALAKPPTSAWRRTRIFFIPNSAPSCSTR